MRKHLFYNFKPPILASKIDKQIVFCPTRSLDLIFIIFLIVHKLVDFGTPFKIQWAPRWEPKSTIFSKLSKSATFFSQWNCFFSRPASPETIVITVPFGPTGFEKVIRWMKAHFMFVSAFLCAIFVTAFPSCFLFIIL